MNNNKYFNNIVKYQKSKKNLQCLGPCYKKNTVAHHPIYIDEKYAKDFNFCHTNEYFIDKDNKRTFKLLDECGKAETDEVLSNSINLLIPIIHFNNGNFLKVYYNIHSFREAVTWVNNKQFAEYNTIRRILDSAWNAYGQDLDYIDDDIVDLYIKITKKYWTHYLYTILCKYIVIVDNKFKLDGSETKPCKDNGRKIEKINFIVNKFITHNNLHNFLLKYIKSDTEKWTDVNSHTNTIKIEFISSLEDKIKRL